MLTIDFLRREHDEVKMGLRVLHELADRMEAGLRVGQHALDHAVEFFTLYCDWNHHAKEEKILFPAVSAKGIVSSGLLTQLRDQHEIGRRLLDRLGVTGRQCVTANRGAAALIVPIARRYVGHMFSHVEQEDRELFCPFDGQGPGPADGELAKALGGFEDERVGQKRVADLLDSLHALAEEYLPQSGKWRLSARDVISEPGLSQSTVDTPGADGPPAPDL
jgi:hemerythrin-like domain-containing protein